MKSALATLSLAALLAAGCSRVPPEEALVRGQAALAAGRYAEAAPLLAVVARANPENPVAFYNLGMSRLLSGDNRGARSAFSESLVFAAGDVRRSSVQGLAEAWRRAGDAEKAIEVYTKAIDDGDRSACLLAGLAGIELECREINAAHTHLMQAAADDRRDPTYLFNAGWLFSEDAKLDVTAAAQFLAEFLATGTNAALYPAQAAAARNRLATLAARRPATLQERIDANLVRSYELEARDPGAALKATAAAYALDQSNADAFKRLLDLSAAAGNETASAKLRERGRLVFPDDPAFRE